MENKTNETKGQLKASVAINILSSIAMCAIIVILGASPVMKIFTAVVVIYYAHSAVKGIKKIQTMNRG